MHFTEDFSKPKIIYPNMTKYTALKEPAFNCSSAHKGSVLPQYFYWITPVLLLDYSSTCIELLQYSLLDYSSTCIGLLQYFYRITPVLLSEFIKVLYVGPEQMHRPPPADAPFIQNLLAQRPARLQTKHL